MVNYTAFSKVGQDFKEVFCDMGRTIKYGLESIPRLTYKVIDYSGELGRDDEFSTKKGAFGAGLFLGGIEGSFYTLLLLESSNKPMTLEQGLIAILGGAIVGLIRGSHSLYEFHKRTDD